MVPSLNAEGTSEHARHRNLAALGLDDQPAVPLLDYLDAAARIDRAQRFEECLSYILEQSAQPEAEGA
jgi:hypothetical protein